MSVSMKTPTWRTNFTKDMMVRAKEGNKKPTATRNSTSYVPVAAVVKANRLASGGADRGQNDAAISLVGQPFSWVVDGGQPFSWVFCGRKLGVLSSKSTRRHTSKGSIPRPSSLSQSLEISNRRARPRVSRTTLASVNLQSSTTLNFVGLSTVCIQWAWKK